jgi:hypothetical protein
LSTTRKQIGTVLFSNVVNQPVFNGQATGKYELIITLDPEQAADAETNGLTLTKSEYNGEEQVKAKLKTKFPLKGQAFVDRYKNAFVDGEGQCREIPRGSKVAVAYSTKPYTMLGKSGVSNYLHGIQVIDENASFEFDAYEEPEEEFKGEF